MRTENEAERTAQAASIPKEGERDAKPSFGSPAAGQSSLQLSQSHLVPSANTFRSSRERVQTPFSLRNQGVCGEGERGLPCRGWRWGPSTWGDPAPHSVLSPPKGTRCVCSRIFCFQFSQRTDSTGLFFIPPPTVLTKVSAARHCPAQPGGVSSPAPFGGPGPPGEAGTSNPALGLGVSAPARASREPFPAGT